MMVETREKIARLKKKRVTSCFLSVLNTMRLLEGKQSQSTRAVVEISLENFQRDDVPDGGHPCIDTVLLNTVCWLFLT